MHTLFLVEWNSEEESRAFGCLTCETSRRYGSIFQALSCCSFGHEADGSYDLLVLEGCDLQKGGYVPGAILGRMQICRYSITNCRRVAPRPETIGSRMHPGCG
jgi:hypothetical protein